MRREEAGGGPPVLFLHGAGIAGWMWRPALAELDPLGVSVRAIVPDLPGHGRSAEGDYVSHADTMAGLVALLEERAPEGATVVGFSLGGQLAIMLAASRPDLVRGVVVVSAETVPWRYPWAVDAIMGASAGLARRPWFARLQARELRIPDELEADYLRDSARVSRATLVRSVGENIRFTLPDGWSRFRGPALVLVGEKERRLMHDSARLTQSSLRGAELRVIRGCSHGIPTQSPREFAQVLAEFMG